MRIEAAKKRTVYTLIAFGLDVSPKARPDDEAGIAFDFLADAATEAGPGGKRVLTGHDNGLVTLNVAEADPEQRERMRLEMGEEYRTLLGHFRHEIGHYYWDRLIRDDPPWLERFRALFGDERRDYGEALAAHYANGAPAGWQNGHISAYAAMHPWEDWAETWAHYLHIADTLEMAAAYRVPLPRRDEGAPPLDGFAGVIVRWLALAEAANSINRCMGLNDLYPFMLSPAVIEKLGFVDALLAQKGNRSGRTDASPTP